MEAIAKKSPKAIGSALKDYEKILNSTNQTKEDEELIKVAKAEQEDLNSSSGIQNGLP